jgi:PAS domain S-box-containing protein
MSTRSNVTHTWWAAVATASALIQLAAVWELVRRGQADVREARLLVIVLVALGLAVALCVRHLWIARSLDREAGVASDQLRLAMESAHEVAWDWDPKTGRGMVFGDLKTVFGINDDRHVGRIDDFRRYVHPDDHERVWRAVGEARERRTKYGATFRVLWPDGTIRWLAASGSFHYGTDREPVRMLGIARDITDRRLTEDKLRESQARLSAIVQSAMDAIIAIDEEQRITVFNPAAETMFGCPAVDALGTSIDRFIPRFREAHARHCQFGDIGRTTRRMGALGELRALRADGEEFPIAASISTGRVEGRRLYTVILRDDTERQKAEAVLRESEERFRLVADTAPVMLWMSGPDRLCTYFNRAWLAFTGRTHESELGNGWADGIYPDDVNRRFETYATAFDRREAFSMEYRLRRHDGEFRWVLDSGVPRFNADGSCAGYIGSAVDVTLHRAAADALADLSHRLVEAHESERARIARELHDDIAQRMAIVTIELDGLSQALSPSAADLNTRIRTLSDYALHLAKDIQALSHQLHSSTLDYQGIASASESFCRELSKQHSVDIAFSCQNVPDDVPRDVALCLFRVLQEAVNNAVKHAGVGQVAVTLCGADGEIRLEVVDTGIGFDQPAAMKNCGLGLISMQERVRLVDGKIVIESRPGEGTAVRVRMPLGHAGGVAVATPA